MQRLPWWLRSGLTAALATAPVLAAPTPAEAHEIPSTVTVQAFVKPQGQRLRLLVRAPLSAMRDMDFPERGPGYLDVDRARPQIHDAARLWIADYLAVYEDGERLRGGKIVAARVSLPSDPSFRSFEEAASHLTGPPLPSDVQLPVTQGLLDVMIEYPIASEESEFAIRAEWAHLGIQTTTVLRFLPPGGAERVLQYSGDPGLVRLDPRWYQAVLRFVQLGFLHILEGIDHILFVLCLVIPFRRFGPLVPVVTAFTVAHSITLIASAMGLAPNTLWFPPLIETLIALSIVYMAFENIVGAKLQRRWMLAFGFGLVHGFGFSFVLRESLQFAGGHLFTSLLAFNIGVELGQLLVLLVAIPVLELLFRRVVAERIGTILLSALVAHTAWHWMTDRGSQLGEYRFELPAMDVSLLAGAMRWTMLLLIVGGAAWMLRELFGRTAPPEDASGRRSPVDDRPSPAPQEEARVGRAD